MIISVSVHVNQFLIKTLADGINIKKFAIDINFCLIADDIY